MAPRATLLMIGIGPLYTIYSPSTGILPTRSDDDLALATFHERLGVKTLQRLILNQHGSGP